MTIAKKILTFQVELLKTHQNLRLPRLLMLFLLRSPRISTMNTSPKIMMTINTNSLRQNMCHPSKKIWLMLICTSPRHSKNSLLTIRTSKKMVIIQSTMITNQFKRNSLFSRLRKFNLQSPQ